MFIIKTSFKFKCILVIIFPSISYDFKSFLKKRAKTQYNNTPKTKKTTTPLQLKKKDQKWTVTN